MKPSVAQDKWGIQVYSGIEEQDNSILLSNRKQLVLLRDEINRFLNDDGWVDVRICLPGKEYHGKLIETKDLDDNVTELYWSQGRQKFLRKMGEDDDSCSKHSLFWKP